MRLTICSAVAMPLVAFGVLLIFTGSASVALADVIKAAEKHQLVKYTMTQSDDQKNGSTVRPLVQVAHADLKSPRFRSEHKNIGSLMGALDFECIFIIDGTKNLKSRTITEVITDKGKTDPKLIEDLKGFEKLGVPRKEVSLFNAHGDFTPATAALDKSILENIQELEKHKDVVATKGKLNGKDVLKYRIEKEHETTLLVVDPITRLPLKLEHEITDPAILHPTVTKMKFVLSDFEWDPDLKDRTVDELFDMTPPKGYTVEDERK